VRGLRSAARIGLNTDGIIQGPLRSGGIPCSCHGGCTNTSLVVLASALCLAVVVAVGAVVPVGAQATPQTRFNFTAFAVNLGPGPKAGTVQISLERLSSSEERATLAAAFKEGGQNALLRALQAVRPRVGFIRTPNSLG